MKEVFLKDLKRWSLQPCPTNVF